jgi:3-oxoadipate enol-lactonase
MCDTPGGIFPPGVALERPRVSVPAEEIAPIGSLPTYARDYFARRPEFAFLYDELRILGARPPADAIEQIRTLRHDLDAVKARLTMPVLCLVGEDDLLIPPAMVRAIAEFLPNARMVTVPDCGHSIYFEQPAVFNQVVRDFLNQVGYGPPDR